MSQMTELIERFSKRRDNAYVVPAYGRNLDRKNRSNTSWVPSSIGIECFQCGVRRLPTSDYFDAASLVANMQAIFSTAIEVNAYRGVPVCYWCQRSIWAAQPLQDFDSKKSHVYQLCYPGTCVPFYVGCTNNPMYRFRLHCRREDKSPRSRQIIGLLRQTGLAPTMYISAVCDDVNQGIEIENRTMLDLLVNSIPITNRRFKDSHLFGFETNSKARLFAKQLWDKWLSSNENLARPD